MKISVTPNAVFLSSHLQFCGLFTNAMQQYFFIFKKTSFFSPKLLFTVFLIGGMISIHSFHGEPENMSAFKVCGLNLSFEAYITCIYFYIFNCICFIFEVYFDECSLTFDLIFGANIGSFCILSNKVSSYRFFLSAVYQYLATNLVKPKCCGFCYLVFLVFQPLLQWMEFFFYLGFSELNY